MKELLVDRATTAVATAGVAAPVWLPPLKQVSEVAGLVLPILGVIWLVVQIVSKIMRGK